MRAFHDEHVHEMGRLAPHDTIDGVGHFGMSGLDDAYGKIEIRFMAKSNVVLIDREMIW